MSLCCKRLGVVFGFCLSLHPFSVRESVVFSVVTVGLWNPPELIFSLWVTSRFIEEPTAPDDILGHAAIRKALKPHGIGVATGEHAHNRMVFKQLLQAEAIDVVQIDSCRLAGVSEVISVLLMAAKCVVSM